MIRFCCIALVAITCFGADDRAAAEWVLRATGRVRVVGNPQVLTAVEQLPTTAFQLEAVDLVGTLITPAELENLSHCEELKEIILPEPSFNEGAGSQRDSNDDFKHLATLSKLERLHFSLHFLTNVNVRDKGLEKLAPLVGLKELRLSQSRVRGSSLKPFVNMERLELNYSFFDDDGMAALAAMKKLKVLQLKDTLVTDRGAAQLENLPSLEELDLYGARLTDAGVRHLAGAKNLRSLNLLGSHITDEGVETLASLPSLEELVLYRSEISNTGLARLQSLKRLEYLDVRYTRVSRGGIDAFRKALPNCRIQYQETSPQTASAELRNSKPSTATPQAIAAWVKKLGGRVEFAENNLREIDLSRTAVTDTQLTHLVSLTGLKKLSLESTEAGDIGMASIAKLTNLEQLNLSHTIVTDKGLAALQPLRQLRRLLLNNAQQVNATGLPAFPQLEDLELSGTDLNNQGLENVARNGSLRALRASYTNITDDGLKLVAALQQLRSLDLAAVDLTDAGMPHLNRLPELRELNISYGRFSDKGLAALGSMTTLQRLEVARTRATDAAMQTLAKLTDLRRLNLDYTAVSDKGVETLRAALPQLVELRLDTANITDAAVETLGGFAHLKYLNLYHTLVTEQALEKLKKAMPDCRIVYDVESSLPNRRKS